MTNKISMNNTKGRIQKSVSLNKDTVDLINNNTMFGIVDFSAKIKYIIAEYNFVINATLKEINNMFTEEEMNILRDVCNCLIITPSNISPAIILHTSLVDQYTLSNTEVPKELEKKILNLSYSQSLALVRNIQAWWSKQPLQTL